MQKLLAAIAVIGAVGAGLSVAPASATQARSDGIANGGQTQLTVVADDLSAAKRKRRHVVRHYTYPQQPYPYGYYGPTRYDRPYRRPAPLWFGIGGWW